MVKTAVRGLTCVPKRLDHCGLEYMATINNDIGANGKVRWPIRAHGQRAQGRIATSANPLLAGGSKG